MFETIRRNPDSADARHGGAGGEAVQSIIRFSAQAAGAADYIILVGEKQAKPIKDGALEAGFDPDKLFVVKWAEGRT